jgi:hypothetical protein
MTGSAVGRLSVWRVLLALVVVVDLVSFFFFVENARAAAVAEGIAFNGFTDFFSGKVVRGVVVCIGVAGAIGFARRAGRVCEGLLALGALVLLSTAHAQLYGSPWRHLFYSGLCLSGWLAGLAVSRWRGAPTDESYACVGTVALLGAAYFNAGISKIVYGGIDWASGSPIQAVIIGQDGMVADSIISVYRSWLVSTPAAASFFSIATLGFELTAPLMLVGRRTRICVAFGLICMHLNIYVLTGILYWESMVFLVAFGLAAPSLASDTTVETAPAIGSHDHRFAVGVVLLALGAAMAITHQGWRAHVRHLRITASRPVPRLAPSPPLPPQTPGAP